MTNTNNPQNGEELTAKAPELRKPKRPLPDMPTVIWLQEFCEGQGVSTKTGRRLVGSGEIDHVRINNRIGFLPEHITDWHKRNTVLAVERPRSSVSEAIAQAKAKLTKGGPN